MPILRDGTVEAETIEPLGGGARGPATRANLGDAGGLTQFGVALETLQPGDRSSDRHWHSDEDEFLLLLDGQGTLVDDDGTHALRPDDAVAWPAGVSNGHMIENRSDAPLRFLVIGTRATRDVCTYSDVDKLQIREGDRKRLTRRDGSPLEGKDTQ